MHSARALPCSVYRRYDVKCTSPCARCGSGSELCRSAIFVIVPALPALLRRRQQQFRMSRSRKNAFKRAQNALVRFALSSDDTVQTRALLQYIKEMRVARAPILRSPRALYRYFDIPPVPMWIWIREGRRDPAFVRYLGFHVDAFERIAEACRADLAKYDHDLPVGPGRATKMGYKDVVAFTLRRLQLNVSKDLEVLMMEFGITLGTVSKLVKETRGLLLPFLQPYITRGLPTADAAKEQLEGFYAQHRTPDIDPDVMRLMNLCLIIDGTRTGGRPSRGAPTSLRGDSFS